MIGQAIFISRFLFPRRFDNNIYFLKLLKFLISRFVYCFKFVCLLFSFLRFFFFFLLLCIICEQMVHD